MTIIMTMLMMMMRLVVAAVVMVVVRRKRGGQGETCWCWCCGAWREGASEGDRGTEMLVLASSLGFGLQIRRTAVALQMMQL
jgi:Flp pilus assembly protein CpaB